MQMLCVRGDWWEIDFEMQALTDLRFCDMLHSYVTQCTIKEPEKKRIMSCIAMTMGYSVYKVLCRNRHNIIGVHGHIYN